MVNVTFDILTLSIGLIAGFIIGCIVVFALHTKDYVRGYSDGQDNGWLKNYISMRNAYEDLLKKHMNLSDKCVADKRRIIVLEEKLKEEKENHAKENV